MLGEHRIGLHSAGQIDLNRVRDVLCDDWGFWYSADLNLALLHESVQRPGLDPELTARIRMQIDQALGAQGKRLNPTYEVTLINTALAMTAQGLGLAILPATMLPADQFPTLIARPLVRPAITRPVSLLQRQGRTLSPAAQAFVATARAVLAQHV